MNTHILSCQLALAARSNSNFYEGTKKVAYAKKLPGEQSSVKFEGLNKEFLMPTDTLKKGDLVYFVKKNK